MAERLVSKAVIGAADPQAVAAWSNDLSDSFIMCRDFGHTWRPFRARLTEEGHYERTLRCGRCRTERSQDLDRYGETVRNNYSYPEGYQAPKGQGRMDSHAKAALRLESTLRLISKDER